MCKHISNNAASAVLFSLVMQMKFPPDEIPTASRGSRCLYRDVKIVASDAVFFIPGSPFRDGILSACSYPGVAELTVYCHFLTEFDYFSKPP